MEIWHQNNLLYEGSPFDVFMTDVVEFPPHWHEEIEIIYVLGDELSVGLNNEIYCLKPRDILLIGAGEIHHFPFQSKKCRRLIVQFNPAILDDDSHLIRDIKIKNPHLKYEGKSAHDNIRKKFENIILDMADESGYCPEGFIIALKAKLFELVVNILRNLPVEFFSNEQRVKKFESLKRLDKVFLYVNDNYDKEISLEEISGIANFSVFHFTRFFKNTTGMTFFKYLNKFRVSKAANLLIQTSFPITDIAFKTGFNSIKTFNRVFKQIEGSSPTDYKKSNI